MYKGIQKESWISIGAILLLAIWSAVILLFALMSGAEAAEGTVIGVVAGAPNVFPWLIPFVLLYVTWKRQIIGGFLFLLFGVATILFLGTYQTPSALVIISVPVIVLGLILMTQNMWDTSAK